MELVFRKDAKTRATRKLESSGSGDNFGVQRSDVYFWDVALRAHCGKVMRVESVAALRATRSGSIQMCACLRLRKIGDDSAPQSAGCSRMNSAPAEWAARNRLAVRRTISLDWVNTRACCEGTLGKPNA
eukprot:6200100-Pleurochrysis_carterae.AAC.7